MSIFGNSRPSLFSDSQQSIQYLKRQLDEKSKQILQLRSKCKKLQQQLKLSQKKNSTIQDTKLSQTNSKIVIDSDQLGAFKGKTLLMQKFLIAIQQLGITTQAVFRIADKQSTNSVQFEQLIRVLQQMQLNLNSQQINVLIQIFDENFQGFITKDNYLNSLKAYQISIQEKSSQYTQNCINKFCTLLDSKKINPSKFYDRMKQSKTFPACVNLDAFQKHLTLYFPNKFQQRQIVGVFNHLKMGKQLLIQKRNFLYKIKIYSQRLISQKPNVQIVQKIQETQEKITNKIQQNIILAPKTVQRNFYVCSLCQKLQETYSQQECSDCQYQGLKVKKDSIVTVKQWKNLKIDHVIIQALKNFNIQQPTVVQAQVLQTTCDDDRKKYNYLIRSLPGTGKTFCLILSVINFFKSKILSLWSSYDEIHLSKNEIYKPQGVIIISNHIAFKQYQDIMNKFIEYGKTSKSQQLNFQLGIIKKGKITNGHIVLCQIKQFSKQYHKGKITLSQCKFFGIDDVEQIYHSNKKSLSQVLNIIKNTPNTHLASCCTIINKSFLNFYEQNGGKFETNKQTYRLKDYQMNVKNYYVGVGREQQVVHKFIIKRVFKSLYDDTTKLKPQIILFFNSIQQINRFSQILETIASDFTSDQSGYLKGISKGIIAQYLYVNGEKQLMTIQDQQEIIQRFKNNEINILLATNIICRGFDVRNSVLVINVDVPRKQNKNQQVDKDVYLRRIGRVGRHTDHGLSLTIADCQNTQKLINGIQKAYGLQIQQMLNQQRLVKQVDQCIAVNKNKKYSM